MYAYARYCGVEIKIEAVDRTRFLFLGFFSFVNVVGAMLALKYISASRFAIFQPSIPCIATFISIMLGMEQITVMKVLGIALAVGGAVIAEAFSSSSDDESNVMLGTIIVTCQVVAMGSLMVFVKPMLSKYTPAVVTLVYYSIGAVYTLFLTCGWAYSLTPGDLIFNSNLLPWLGLAYAATFATFYPYNALSWAGKQLTPGATTVYCTFQPVGTILLSFIVLGAVVTLSEGMGAVLVIIGLLVTVLGQQYEAKARRGDGSSKFGAEHSSDSEDETEEFYMDSNFRDVRSVSGSGGNPLTEKLNGDYRALSTSEPNRDTSYLRV